MVDLKQLEIELAKNKVYDAWQYIESLQETLSYMCISYDLLEETYNHRRSALNTMTHDILKDAIETGKGTLTTEKLNCTDLDIAGYKINDILFMRKNVIEFFHYGRISMDVLFQIINAALLADEAYSIEDKGLLNKVIAKLKTKTEFEDLINLLETNKNDSRFTYLMAFDNHIKHIKTILITIKNSIIIGDDNSFELNDFSYGDNNFSTENALDKIQELHDYILDTIDSILNELLKNISHGFSTSKRVYDVCFKQVFNKKGEQTTINHLSFFIIVPNDITDLPNIIKVHPLIIKPNMEVFDCDFKFDKIFIKKNSENEEDIVGVATLNKELSVNEFYGTYEIKPCTYIDYGLYLATFNEVYNEKTVKMNYCAMTGEMLFLEE